MSFVWADCIPIQSRLPPAVTQLSMRISAGERLGIVGRTGAGKSSISVMLLRLVELESGSISLDGTDLNRIGLHTVRRAITMVPQDPFLFLGSVARNLDPLSFYDQDKLAAAVKRVGLDISLESDVGSGGSCLSAGERQLVAIARATLSSAKVVVMDEPTASCDATTDAHLQEVVRSAFFGRTTLCIAHRLNTILGYDRVLVMEAGLSVELDTPSALLANPASRFSNLGVLRDS